MAARLAEALFEERTDFATTFADQCDDVEIGGCLFGDLAQQGALSDAATGEQANPLAHSDRQQAVDDPLPGDEGTMDAIPFQGMGCLFDHFAGPSGSERTGVVDRAAQTVEDATEQGLSHGNLLVSTGGDDVQTGTQSVGMLEAHDLRAVIVHADHFTGEAPVIGETDFAEFANRRRKVSGQDLACAKQFPCDSESAAVRDPTLQVFCVQSEHHQGLRASVGASRPDGPTSPQSGFGRRRFRRGSHPVESPRRGEV